MRTAAAVIALLMALPSAPPAFAAESAYTTLNFNDGSCKPAGTPATQEEIDMGVSDLICPGYKGYPVQFSSDDERESVHYGDPKTATTGPVWEAFVPFNSVNDKFEWRLAGGKPFAAIHRFRLSTGEEEPAPGSAAKGPVKGQVLVISKVGQPGGPAGCVVGLVDALENADSNTLARKVADELAPSFRCGQDKAVYHGKRGDKAADFNAYFDQ